MTKMYNEKQQKELRKRVGESLHSRHILIGKRRRPHQQRQTHGNREIEKLAGELPTKLYMLLQSHTD